MPDDFYEQMDRAGHPGRRRLPVLRRLAAAGQRPDQRSRLRGAASFGADDRPEPAQPPERPELQLERQQARPSARRPVSLQGFQQADFQEPLIASAEYKSQRRSSARRARRRARTTGSRRATGTTPRTTTRATRPGPTSGGAWALRQRGRAPATPSRRSTRSTASCRRSSRPTLWQNPDYNQYHANYEPDLPGPHNGGYSFGTLHDLDTRSAAATARGRAWASTSRRPRSRTTRPSAPSSRPTSTTRPTSHARRPASSTGSSTRAGRRCCGTSTTTTSTRPAATSAPRRPTSRCTCSTPTTTARVSVDNLGDRDRGRPVGRGQGLRRRRQAARRPDRERDLGWPARASRTGVLHPSVPAATTPPAPPKTYFVELLLRRHGAVVDRNVYWLSTQQDVVNWSKTIGNPQATMTQYANLSQLQGLAPARVQRDRAHTTTQSATAGASHDVTITNTSTKPTVGVLPARRRPPRQRVGRVPRRGDNEVLPVFWSDNDVTLWPGESETLQASYRQLGPPRRRRRWSACRRGTSRRRTCRDGDQPSS